MRNLLFVLVFISITVLGCGGNKSPLENCADERQMIYYYDGFEKLYGLSIEQFLKKSYKKKMQNPLYKMWHKDCEEERMVAPKIFDAEYQ